MTDRCIFCEDKFEDESIKRYDYWDLQLFRDDQYYIGRTVAVFKSRHIVDVTELESEEREELFNTVIPELQESLDSLFEPDLYNYTSIGNDCRHLHFHIIPRYKKSKTFNGKQFEDEQWDETYAQDYQPVLLDEKDREDLIARIKSNMPD